MPTLRDLIDDGRVHVLDGAMGTMLYSKGVFVNVCYDELNLREPTGSGDTTAWVAGMDLRNALARLTPTSPDQCDDSPDDQHDESDPQHRHQHHPDRRPAGPEVPHHRHHLRCPGGGIPARSGHGSAPLSLACW
jgi:hypothetical protein